MDFFQAIWPTHVFLTVDRTKWSFGMAIAKISTDIFDPLLDVSMSGKKSFFTINENN
ncbi:MAG: hypothetical protein WC384_02380 [Prolixibacteraceae bacterium]